MDIETATTDDDRLLFDRPLFEDPSARALDRVGVIDVGSNSVRLVVFDGAARSPAYFYNEKVMAGLGQGLAQTGRLHQRGRERALAALKRFAALADGMKLPPLNCVATAAVREAADGADFCAEVENQTGLRLRVIDGREEARLSAQGVLLGWPEAEGLVCDIGGNSMELAEVSGGQVGQRVTSPLGPFRLQQVAGGKKGIAKFISETIDGLAAEMGTGFERIYLVGGSFRAIARLDMERRAYPLTVLHEYRMRPRELLKTIAWIGENDLSALRARTGTSAARMELVPLASQVLKQLVRRFRPKEIDVSSYGIREGMLYEQMSERQRRRDPLIEACRHAERTMARMPGFGKQLYQFILPVFNGASDDRLRMVRAACLLHDTTWRAHPDYRAEVCFDNATRANLGGLSHSERVFLGLALLHRYKNSRAGSRLEPLFGLLTEKQLREAEVLGKAMRFGAMFAIRSPEDAGGLVWRPKKKVLELKLRKKARALFGEVAEARFKSLADALGSEGKVSAIRD
ncbi:Guanosine-5'-triphosphate,3'-diphosphate pyrophosphatase [Defluviimonas aquaemixtae]|uniref:Guanosine-5'-triphosphate,3'-diphosphate pyrophosphatase n=1 Tax=Albidovulum aquaemixtae TaxID=1542388 RepID=A0A2R8B7B4_9RHOB|nr:Ppx/GppA family phosphatase [Defluviimonas aquaemixtae]SPH18508.1 Guanosine-5'-triphosphate,3'-diphosphate pyrophosphatase [Defluviimonas aquaemixtae]